MRIALIIIGLSFVVALRCVISFHSYSGFNKPPMFGDYEAQRHWMEITYNLPINQWYHNSSDNDLLYWGLDYPPLTAYHSWICGFIKSKLNSSWVELRTSRGLQDETHKLFMRYSVLVVDLLIYIPALLAYFLLDKEASQSFEPCLMASFLMLTYPGLILIDHGHFQYNCVSLGLMLWAVVILIPSYGQDGRGGREVDEEYIRSSYKTNTNIKNKNPLKSSKEEYVINDKPSENASKRRHASNKNNDDNKKNNNNNNKNNVKNENKNNDKNNNNLSLSILPLVFSSIFFTLSLNYKQMQLYHSLPFFFFFLGVISFSQSTFTTKCKALLLVGGTVILTCVLCWWPFIWDFDDFTQVIHRLFPFNRGLFEDKVANVWCTLSVIIKLKTLLSPPILVKMCLITTLLTALPSCLSLFFRPSFTQFKLSLLNVSLSFFLFSYQVHEKSILLAAVPMMLLYRDYPVEVVWFLIVTVFRVFHTIVAGFYTLPIFRLFIMLPLFIKDSIVLPSIASCVIFYILSTYKISHKKDNLSNEFNLYLFYFSMLVMAVLSFVLLSFPPLVNLPDLYTLLVTSFCCVQFCYFLLYFNFAQVSSLHKSYIKIKIE